MERWWGWVPAFAGMTGGALGTGIGPRSPGGIVLGVVVVRLVSFDRLRKGHHERLGGLVDDGEDGGLGVTGRTGCGRGSSAGVVELTGWHVALGRLGAAGSRLRTPG